MDYAIDWSAWLPSGDSITSATWTAGDGITVVADPAPSIDGGKTVVWLSGGTAGQTYEATCHIVTVQGRENEKTIRVRVREQ